MHARSADKTNGRRRGTILPFVAVALVTLCGFVALAVDVGMVAVAKTECQNAADSAALAGARSIDGSASPNLSAATSAAQDAVTASKVLAASLDASDVAIRHGTYHYDTGTQAFYPQFPPLPASDTYNLTEATVTRTNGTGLMGALGIATFDVTAKATASHRPRDVTIILDFSGSMNDESDLWNNVATTHLGSFNNKTNNSDPDIPKFGHYSDTTTAALQNTSIDARTGKSNVSQASLGIPALVNDFYQHNRGSTAVPAFTSVPFTGPENYATASPGDKYMAVKSGTAPAKTVQEITGATNAQVTGRTDPVMPGYTSFQGFTRGPDYWGKTFFIWPPDPAPANDWRQKFFGTNDNTRLWDGSGNWNAPSGSTYTINYAKILDWIKNTGPNPFPAQLRSGRIQYYSQIPTDVPASAYNHSNANSAITDADQRFWKEYIDYVLGVWRDPYGNVIPGAYLGLFPVWSMGPDYNWGTFRVSGPVTNYPSSPGPTTRMHPQDNPKRPRHRFWFGPMTMMQFLSDTGLLPGTGHDISLYPAKLGISGALQDIKNNHPNDLVSLILFSRPQYDNDPVGTGRYNDARFSLSRDYTGMIDALWFPPGSSTTDVRPWDANGVQTPRSTHDYANNTATSFGMMLAYNQLSGNSTLRSQALGGLGRKGAQRLVVLETDGMANVDSIPVGGFVNGGVNNSYYRVRSSDTVNSGNYSQQALLQAVQALCNKADGTPGTSPGYSPNPGYPGYAQTRKPVLVHTIAFGAIFESSAAGTDQTTVVDLLQQISQIGGTRFPSSPSDPTDGYKWCVGTIDQRKDKLRQAFSKVMDDGIAITLVE